MKKLKVPKAATITTKSHINIPISDYMNFLQPTVINKAYIEQ